MKMHKYRPKISASYTATCFGELKGVFAEVEISPDQIWYMDWDVDEGWIHIHRNGVRLKLTISSFRRLFEKIGERDEQG